MSVAIFILAKGTHGIINADCILGSPTENDVLRLDGCCRNFFVFLVESTFRRTVLQFILYPYLFAFGIDFIGLPLADGGVNARCVGVTMIHGVSEHLVTHQPSAYLLDGVFLGSGKDDGWLLHGRTEEATARALWRYHIGSKTDKKGIPWCSIDNLAYLLSISYCIR